MAPANHHLIGKALIVYGTVKAISASGSERLLSPNSPIFANERIVTGADGSVSIRFSNGSEQLDLGRMSDVAVDDDVFGAGGQGSGADAVAQVEDIQAALQSGMDPTIDLPAPAAGGGVAGAAGAGARGGGRQIVVFDADQMEVLPDSGAETRGIALDFLDPPPGGVVIEAETILVAPALDLSPQSITVEEEALGTEFGDPDADLTQGYPDDEENPTDIETIDLTALVDVEFGGTNTGSLSYELVDPAGTVAGGLFSAGEQIYYFLNAATGEIEGRAGASVEEADRVVFTVSVNSAGQLIFNLDDKIDHPYEGVDTLAITDLGQYVQVVAINSSGQTAVDTFDGLLTVNVVDDIPVMDDVEDVSIFNREGSKATEGLDVHFGADEAAAEGALQLFAQDGSSLIGKPVVANDGTELTVNGQTLEYADDGNGGVKAVSSSDGNVVFSVEVDPDTLSYTVTLDHQLDTMQTVNLFSGESEGPQLSQEFTVNDNLFVRASAALTVADSGNVYVQWDYNDGIGVYSEKTSDSVDSDSNTKIDDYEKLTLEFFNANGNGQDVNSISFTLNNLNGQADNGMFNSVTYKLSLNGSLVGDPSGYEVFGDADGSVIEKTPEGLSFDTIIFEGEKGSSYQVQSLSIGIEPTITFAVQATDGDGDTTIASEATFDVTFRADDTGDAQVFYTAASSPDPSNEYSSFADTSSDVGGGGALDTLLDPGDAHA